ncbi:hypothetical protein [Streptomyces anandii]|uniref:hypothetical protein n=1 Tax=Streptomyces anandii TaxID=285454 RepID=UPI0037A99690
MADFDELSTERIARSLAKQYAVLIASCEMLPIPVSLPRSTNGELSNVDTVPAVRRLAELAGEQPMPEEIQAALFTAAIFWLTAMDQLGIIIANQWHDIRGFQALAALEMSGSALADLGAWLLDQD